MSGGTPVQVTDIARETIRVLAMRRLAPTPDNYRAVFAELLGRPLPKPPSEQAFERLAERLWGVPAMRLASERLSHALSNQAWGDVDQVLAVLVTRAHEALSLRQQQEGAAAMVQMVSAPPESHAQDMAALAGMMGDLISHWFSQRLAYAPQLSVIADALEQRARAVKTADDVNTFGQQLADFIHQATLAGDTLDEMFKGLLSLMRLLVQHIRELGTNDRLVDRHTARLQAVLNENLTPDSLREAEGTFRQFLERQTELHSSVELSKTALKELVGVLIDRLGQLGSDTSGFGDRIGSYADQLAQTDDLDELSTLVQALVGDARAMQQHVVTTHSELMQARQQVQEYETRMQTLQAEVEAISELVKEDQLTGALNRRGLAQAFMVEAARCDRKQVPLSVAVLDLDNFKMLNDRLGHKAGDEALVHLATVVRQLLRPTDAVARYGGEEFVILLPETAAPEAVRVMERVQRELTKRFYLHNAERVFITFSAGVAQRKIGESQDSAIDRADQAMYQAKRGGKNRVDCAEPLPASFAAATPAPAEPVTSQAAKG